MNRRTWLPVALALFAWLPAPARSAEVPEGVKEVATIEGITEYQLSNGMRVVLYPDSSSNKVTVNLTVFVGSRHEGYGETGMAHLLEHMVFKGTPLHPNVPKALADRGANYNGTTNVDRTNYFETLNATDDNLEFAIRLEADRMVNSLIKREDLASEFSVVRSEFESGENSPARILSQRMLGAAFEWHNYGKSTIGNRSDIEKVPVDRLRVFYRKYYQPDNAMVIITGNFKREKALAFALKHFGKIKKPERELDATYTIEPPQDGERSVVLRRVGSVGSAGAVYHIPAVAHADYPAIEIMASILSAPGSGRLHTALVKTGKATAAAAFAYAGHDPAWFQVSATPDKGQSPEALRDALVDVLEKFATEKVSDEEIDRAKRIAARRSEAAVKDVNAMANVLSEWAAKGDWRLYFLHRDRVAKVTAEDVTRVAGKYLQRSNRTVGVFIPSDTPQRTSIPESPELASLLKNYKGGEAMAAGEFLNPDPLALEKRVQRSKLASGIQVAALPFKARADAVSLRLTLRYGNEDSLKGQTDAAAFLGSLMVRGTKKHTRQQLEDELSKLKVTMTPGAGGGGGRGPRGGRGQGGGGGIGQVTFGLECSREALPKALELLQEVLREPTFPEEEFELMKRQARERRENSRTDPATLAAEQLEIRLSPYGKNDLRYVPTIDEALARLDAVKVDQVRKLYREQLGAATGELVIVGDFDPVPTLKKIDEMLKDWKSDVKYRRVERKAATEAKGDLVKILTPDKANAIYQAGMGLSVKEIDPDHVALLIGNSIFGGGSLSSRLGKRIRQEAGLSYTVASQYRATAEDEAARFGMFAISNPANAGKVAELIREEIDRLLKDGVSPEEVNAAKKAFLEQRKARRSGTQALAGLLLGELGLGRTLAFEAEMDKKVESLTAQDVTAALRKHLDPKKLVIVQAGDFKK